MRQEGETRPLATTFLPGTAALAAAGAVLWFALGMHRGLLLSEDIKSRFWPWAPFHPARAIAAPALSDPVFQFVPWLALARRELTAGTLPLWNPHQDGGVPLLGNAISALGSPLVWPALLLGVARGWNLSLLLRVLAALCGTYLWLRDFSRSRAAAALGACAFALSGPFIAWLEHPQTLVAAAVPFLLLFTRRLARGGSRADFAGLVITTLLALSGGHPETQLMAALLAGGLLVSLAPRGAGVARPVFASLLGAGLAAPLLATFLDYFRVSEARAGAGRRPFTLSPRDLLRFFEPRLPSSNVIEAAATVSVTVLALGVLGLVLGGRRRGTAWSVLAVAAALLVTYDNPVARALALHTPIHWTRALLLLPLPVSFLASGGLDAILAKATDRWGQRPLLSAAAWIPLLPCAVELLAAARGVHGSSPPSSLTWKTPLVGVLAADRDVFRVLPLHTFLPPNAATDYAFDDVRGYDALAPRAWRRRREEIGRFRSLPTQTDALEPWDLAQGGSALDFWNVKYLLLAPQFAFGVDTLNAKKNLDLEEIYSGPDGRIFKNRRCLPRARLSVPGEVRILERRPDRWTMDVEARTPGTLLVANPAFPGWRAFLDGRRIRFSTPRGDPFLLPVPAGGHRVTLSYWPASFEWGLAICGASLLLLLLVLARRRGNVS